MLRRVFLTLLLLALSSHQAWAGSLKPDLELECLSAWLSGSFDSRV
jgi:hypothetical protein